MDTYFYYKTIAGKAFKWFSILESYILACSESSRHLKSSFTMIQKSLTDYTSLIFHTKPRPREWITTWSFILNTIVYRQINRSFNNNIEVTVIH